MYVLPSVPVTVTCVALVAVTVNVDEFPEMIDVGLAVMVMVNAVCGATITVVLAVICPPAPIAVAV